MIEIIEYKPLDRACLKAQVSIRLPKWGGFRIKRIKVFQKENLRWISMPSEEYEQEGKKKYFILNDFDTPKMNDAFRDAFFKAFDEYVQRNAG